MTAIKPIKKQEIIIIMEVRKWQKKRKKLWSLAQSARSAKN